MDAEQSARLRERTALTGALDRHNTENLQHTHTRSDGSGQLDSVAPLWR